MPLRGIRDKLAIIVHRLNRYIVSQRGDGATFLFEEKRREAAK